MNEAGEFDTWDVARGAVDAFEVPDGFRSTVVSGPVEGDVSETG